ncbi:adaptin region, partial [Ancylostoma duodenale]
MYDSGVALGGLSCFVTPDLARDLASDIVNLLSSSRPYTRKRAVLLLYKIFLKYPEALRPTFPRLKDKLEDPDPGVQSAAVNVICELARKNPKNYLTLAPVFFKLMTTSSNNWMLIKIIKLFGALVPLEPRLGKKLLEPLTNLINSTSAMSLLYECINTVIAVLISISAGGDHAASIQLCVQKLGVLIEDSDQNLKYLGLLAMGKILQTHPKAVQAHKDIVLRCLDDKDESIRLRSLDLLYGMVSKKNIMEIVKKLMEHVESAEGSHYRYISVLVELTKVEGTKHGAKIAEQIQDVTVRVESIRHFSVSQMALLVENAHILLAGSAQQRNNISEVLLAAAWICGEYSQHVRNVPSVLESMLRARTSVMSGHILSVYVQNIGKLYSTLLSKAEEEDDWDAIESLDNLMLSKLADFELAEHLEAQERACTLMSILRVVEAAHARREKIAIDIAKLYEGELNPVAPKAQRKVPVPDGLDLDEWINEPWQDTPESSEESDIDSTFGQPAPRIRSEFTSFGCVPTYDDEPKIGEKPKKGKKKETVELSPEEVERRRKAREAERESNPYYVKGTATAPKRPTRFVTMDTAHANDVNRADGEMPEGAKSTDDEDSAAKGVSDEFRALDINLDEPLRPDEVVRGPPVYTRQRASPPRPALVP